MYGRSETAPDLNFKNDKGKKSEAWDLLSGKIAPGSREELLTVGSTGQRREGTNDGGTGEKDQQKKRTLSLKNELANTQSGVTNSETEKRKRRNGLQ